jgi:hypothetical protein
MTTQNTQTKTRIGRTIASVALVGMGMATMFMATAVAESRSGTGMGPGMIDLDELAIIDAPLFFTGSVVTADSTSCIPTGVPIQEGIDIEITNNNTGPRRYQVFFYDGAVEGGQTPAFTFPEDASTESELELIHSYGSEEFDRYWGTADDATVVRVQVTQRWLFPGSQPTVVFDEEVTICETDAEAQLAEAAADYAAEVAAEEAAQALTEAEATAAASEQALAEAEATAAASEQALAEAEATAAASEQEASESAAVAEEAAATSIAQAQAETKEAKADLVIALMQAEKDAAGNAPGEGSPGAPETSDEELAVGEDLGEHSKPGMSGVILGLIIVLGLAGVGAVAGAVLNLRK